MTRCWALLGVLCMACAGAGSRRSETALVAAQRASSECREHAELQRAQQRAMRARVAQLESEVSRLQSDLAQAQDVIVAAESQLSGTHTRAAAVRAVAEARSELESAAPRAPWKGSEAREAGALLGEADEHLRAGHFGAAILLASRAQRMAEAIEAEARTARGTPDALQIAVEQGNLREGPSTGRAVVATLARGTPVFPERREAEWLLVRTPQNQLGWVHRSLVRKLSGDP